MGYTSTSKDFNVAKKFALQDLRDDQIPVIFEIEFKGQTGLFELTPDYTAYPGENEVLVQDGLQYLIMDNTEL